MVWRYRGLAATLSLFRFAALTRPQDAAVIQRVLAIPLKRYEQTIITYLTETETEFCSPLPTAARGPDGVTTPC